MVLAFLALSVNAVAADLPPEPLSHAGMVKAAIEQYIVPHIDALKAAAKPLPDAVAEVCKTGSAEAKRALEDRFEKVVIAYAGVDFLRFGPMLEKGRREQISFWPDPRGFVSRQMRLLLLSKDEGIANPGAIGKQSAAVQGLPALEALMHDKDVPLGPDDAAHYRCIVAGAIAANIVRLTAEVADEWEKPDGWADKMLHPGPQNDTYKNESEAAVEVVKALIVGLGLTADLQVKPQIDSKVRLAPPYDKSGLQKVFYATSVASLHQFYDVLDLESWLPPDRLWMKDWVLGTWRTIEASDGVGGRSPNAKRDDAPTLREVFDRTNGLRNMVANRLSVSAQLTVGFNELDGD
ncbi:MAG: imelysin family protein [Hyphomicrobium sp.]|uniref:imelysin family protein n=1 Tax=Hyphomicrobium sp. TaxID=82 RepID=UPI0039E3CCB0